MGDIYDIEGEAYWKARCEEAEAKIKALESHLANCRHKSFTLRKRVDQLEKKLKDQG